MKSINRPTVLITGASSGIGKHTAYEQAIKGSNLILVARRTDKLEEVKAICEQLGPTSVHIYSVDISQAESIDQFISFLKQEKIKIDVLINNAGFGYSESFFALDFEIVSNIFQVNIVGLMYLTQQIALNMLDNGSGQIVNVASLAGKVSTPKYTAYGATKGALISLSNALRLELKEHNIHVTVVNFGPVDTPFFDSIERSRKQMAKNSPFTLTEDEAGRIVSNTVGTKKREVNRPLILAAGAKFYQMFPSIGDYILSEFIKM